MPGPTLRLKVASPPWRRTLIDSKLEFSHPPGYRDADSCLRVLMAPWNFADQPMALTRAMRARGHFVHQLQYAPTGEALMGYDTDCVLRLRYGDTAAQFEALERCLEQNFRIYHFWQRSLVFDKDLGGCTGIDLPLLKSRGLAVFHRFTGFDLRLPSADMAANPYSPYHQGYQAPFDEVRQRAYIDYLGQYVDRFIVQDPEMQQFLPQATLLPRGLELDRWQVVGVQPNTRPLIVHAPSSPLVKGSPYIVHALDELRHEGLDFEFMQLGQVPFDEARRWYERADIIVDQILIGATGVLTLEAWALGKPCVTYLRPDLFEPFYGTSELPVANANPDNVKAVMKELIRDFDLRAELGRRGRTTVERFHDINVVAERYEAICREALGADDGAPTTVADVHFLRAGFGAAAEKNGGPLSFRLGLAAQYPRAAYLAGVFFASQEKVFAGLVRLQISVLRGTFVALLRLLGRRPRAAEPPARTGAER